MPNNHSEEIKVGNVYSYIYGQPGNDRTLVIVKEIKGNLFKCFDLNFNFDLDLSAGQLIEHNYFRDYEISIAAKYGHGFEYMIRKTLEHFRTKVLEEAKTEAAIDFQHQVHLNTETFAKLNDAARLLESIGYKWDVEKQTWNK
ncbi:hypothetical protein [Enterobacter cloacae]|uniref:hypothetical protein n=1 Tax=Enterobacter cloacae TaxID=550 RepID=UPI003F44E832